MKIPQMKVATSRPLTEEEALAMLRTLKPGGRGGRGLLDAVKDYILGETTSGRPYGLFSIKSVSNKAPSEEERKQVVIRINADFKRTNYQIGVRNIPESDNLIYAPLSKMTEIFG